MMLTHAQAAVTWCPMVRAPRDDMFSRCIASGCAMWRWHDKPAAQRDARTWWPDEDEPVTEPPRPKQVPADAVWIPLTGEGEDLQGGCWEEPQFIVDADNAAASAGRRGYCGLAGAPIAQGGAA